MQESDDGHADDTEELRRIYGDDIRPFAGSHHARFIDPDVPLHIISRVFQGRHLLRPSPLLNKIIVGVVARGLEAYPDVRLFAIAVLTNHMHLQAQGPADQIAGFVGYIKKEISRRWGGHPKVGWSDSMWAGRYVATALPTAESQMKCLRYILANGVKEGLVSKSQLWPGVHSAHALLTGRKLRGEWFDSTAWSRAKDAAKRRKHETKVRKADYFKAYEVELTPIPAWRDLTVDQRRAEVGKMLAEIEEEGRVARQGRPPLGAKAICEVPLDRRTALEPPPWFEHRRRFICWADPDAPETRDYLDRYWQFQRAFRRASEIMRAGDLTADFPPCAFRPVTYHRATAPPS